MSSTTATFEILQRKPRNIAVHTNPNHDLHVFESNVPEPGPNECLVHVRATGICGSDVHFWKHGHIGDMVVVGENGLGHESAGVVIKTGKDVKRFKPGDRVALECGIPCSLPTCYFCRTGRYNACPKVKFFSTPPFDGTLRRYHVHPEAWLHSLPESMTFEEGSLLEPLSVAFACIDRSNLRLGNPLVICGAGPIGLVTLLAAHAAGAAPIAITDLDENRLAKARELVSRVRTVKVERSEDSKALGQRIVELLGREAELAIECTGVESSVHAAIYASKFGGSVFIVGVGKDFQNIPFMHLASKEIDLRFQYRYHDTYPKAISLVTEGLIDLKPLVTHRFSLEDGVAAFGAASDPLAKAIKVQILDD